MKIYDYLVVGAGLYGAVFAREATDAGKKVLVIDKRNHIAGNIYTEKVNNINVHKYGAHIFHTNNKQVWNYVNRFAEFNRYTNSPVANYKGELYSLPFNMYTFNRMWGVNTPDEAMSRIEEQKKAAGINNPANLEEQAISLVGIDIYEKLVKGYTEKQWGRKCTELPAFIIKRLPVRFTFDNNYFDALYQGIPMGGYTKLVEKMLEGIEVILGEDYLAKKDYYDSISEKVIYTGPIDAYFDYKLGTLQYRSVRFETERLETDNYQGNAVINYTDSETPWTRIIEHKWFEFGKDEAGNDIQGTIISKEYSNEWSKGDEPYYPVNDVTNNELYNSYKELASEEENVIFGGRLGEYKYYDMDAVIEAALKLADTELGNNDNMINEQHTASKLEADLGFAKVDLERSERQGVTEVIYGAGKTKEQIYDIAKTLIKNGEGTILVTRIDSEKAEYVKARFAKEVEATELSDGITVTSINYNEIAKIMVIGENKTPYGHGPIVVATGGTSDQYVAEEAAITAEALGNEVIRLYDVGVAGIHRLLSRKNIIEKAAVIIAIAGMEGALASVIGGLASCPVIAVPTSVGYGANFGGLSALLSMMNSCASGVSVVNIDNGFGAGYQASLINHLGIHDKNERYLC